MKAKTYDTILQKIDFYCHRREQVDYSRRSSVRMFNSDYMKCRENVELIDNLFPDRLCDFGEWVFASDWKKQALLSPMILHLENASFALKCQAVDSIAALLDNPDVDSLVKLGFSMNFRNHEYDQWLPKNNQAE